MSPVGRDGHGYDGCTCKGKIIEQDLSLSYMCIRGGASLLHLNLAVGFNCLLALVEKGEVSFVYHMFTLISSAEFPLRGIAA